MRILSAFTYLAVAAISSQIDLVSSHGRLIQPPQRSSAWRYGYNIPANYNDHELSCGGFGVQWNSVNDGRCGVCGDPFSDVIKQNEDLDGKYVRNSVVTGSYVKGGVLLVKVELTANHKGWFEFRLCPLATVNTKVTQECLNKTLLQEAGGSATRFRVNTANTGIFEYSLQLPEHIYCERCVLQWRYNTGNSWGCESLGCGIGYGKQENFVNCADIEIIDNGISASTTTSSSTFSQSVTMSALTSSTTSKLESSSSPSTTSSDSTSSQTTTSTVQPSPSSQITSFTSASSTTTASRTTSRATDTGRVCSSTLTCSSKAPWNMIPGMDLWCCTNFLLNNCPASHCTCIKT